MTGTRLIVGLDYGTTYTGVSYCEVSNTKTQPEQIEIIHDWPSQHSKVGTKDKVPSEIAFLTGGVVWGSLIPSNVVRHMWTKLQLDDVCTGHVAKVQNEISAAQAGATKQPVDIVATFLREVKNHLMKVLDQKYSKALWSSLPVVLVVTVPAVWSDLAKSRTLEAVCKAGFNSTELPQLQNTIVATEPECAAIYTIKTLRNTIHDADFAVGDGFTVCDMGGGTVDLISYRVTSLNPVRVEEATVGNGDQCGGSFVDRAFLTLLEKRLGSKDFEKIAGCRSEELPLASLSAKASRMLQDFNLEAKSGFSGTETYFLRLPPPLSGIEEDGIRGILDGEMELTPDDMKSLFEYCILRTFELLNQQLKQMRKQKQTKVKYVFMVGGFSESPYVFNRIKEFFEDAYDLSVLKPVFAWSSVARGAVAKGMEGDEISISQRKCRRHYGNAVQTAFITGKHLECDAFNDEFTGEKRASNQMSWLLHKGQNLSTTESCHGRLLLHRKFWPGKARVSSLQLRAADCNKAPKRSVDSNVYSVSHVDVDLSKVPNHKFERLRNDRGQEYYYLEFEIEIAIKSTIEYSLWVDGVKYGTLTATYE